MVQARVHFRFQVGKSVALLLAFLLTACAAASPTATLVPQTKLSVQLSWIHGLEFAGFYMADKQGYFAEHNLAVDLVQGGYDDKGNYIDPVQAVLSGKANFGIAGADVVLTGRAQGQPLVAVATIYQRSPVALISLSKKNINKPQDLIGKRVNTEPGTTVGLSYDALLASQNIDHKQVTEIPRTDFTAKPVLDDQVDVLVSFITDDAIQVKRILDTYGKDLPADVQSLQEAGLLASIPLLNPQGSRPGKMQPEKWDFTYQVLTKQGLLPKAIDPKSAYTLKFLDAVYGG